MALYPNAKLTNSGLNLIGESIAESKALIFTKVVFGNGQLSADQDITLLTQLINPILPLSLVSGSHESGEAKLRFVVSNTDLETGFFAREVGIFAKVGDEGVEQLYAYTNGGNYVDYIPDKNTPIEAQTLDIYALTGSAETIKVIVDDGAYITVVDFNEHKDDADAHEAAFDKHNKDENAHKGIFAPILGAIMKGILYLIDPADDSDDNQGATTGWTRRMFRTLLEAALNASGIQYNIAQNGYIKLGDFFGGLILQWGYGSNNMSTPIPFPISFSSLPIIIPKYAGGTDAMVEVWIRNLTVTGFTTYTFVGTALTTATNHGFRWIAIGT